MTIALVTLFNPKREVTDHIRCIKEQVDYLCLCDNSLESHENLFQGIDCEYIHFGKNLGLSGAFNQVLKKSQKYNISEDDFIIFFDQDSKIPSKHISRLVNEYNYLEKNQYNVGCLGTAFFNTNRSLIEMPKVRKKINDNTYIVKSVITSSMICRYDKLKKVGYWNEEIFLDMADWDLCWRFMEKKMICCITDVSVLEHTVGEGDKKVGCISMRVGKPFRDYYQIRDCLYLIKKRYTPFKFKLRFIQMLTIRGFMRLLFLEQRKERLHYMLKGIHDYKHNIHGGLVEK